jgi:hypothetical protein
MQTTSVNSQFRIVRNQAITKLPDRLGCHRAGEYDYQVKTAFAIDIGPIDQMLHGPIAELNRPFTPLVGNSIKVFSHQWLIRRGVFTSSVRPIVRAIAVELD